MKTHNTLNEIMIAEIAVAALQDELRAAEANLRRVMREHDVSSSIVESDMSRSDMLEALHDEGFAYETAEAILCHEARA